MPKYQIFISSTFQDLQDERRAVTEQILNMGHIPVGMELFQASDDDQWTYISDRLKEMDYYVVIVAERYGSIDPKTGFSYTEKENRLAIDLGIPTVAFLLRDDQRKLWPRDRVEFDRKTKVDDFRQLCQSRMTKYWSDTNGLALCVTNALHELFRKKPRPGLVPATEAASAQALGELARLSEENHRLSDRLKSALEAAEEKEITSREREVIKALSETTLSEFLSSRNLTAYSIKSANGDADTAKKTPTELKMSNDTSLLDVLKFLFFFNASRIKSDALDPVLRVGFGQSVSAWGLGGKLPEGENSRGEFEILNALVRLSILSSASEEEEMFYASYKMLGGERQKKYKVTIYQFTDFGRRIISATTLPTEILLGGAKKEKT